MSGMLNCLVCCGNLVIGAHRQGNSYYRCGIAATRGKEVCNSSAYVSCKALEEKVRHVLDRVAKDPQQLGEPVREHNDRVDEHNWEHAGEADRLTAQRTEAQQALGRLVAAIESGGVSATVMQAIQRREKEVEDLTQALDRARPQVQPKIEPLVGVQDSVSGPKSLFDGTIEHDKALVEQALERIEVAADCSIALVFRADSMFRFQRWSGAADEVRQSTKDMRRILAIHAALPGQTPWRNCRAG